MIVCQSGLHSGDCVCEIPCPPCDEGKRWIIDGFACGGGVAVCRLLHPTRTERRLIPVARIHLIARDCPAATEAARDPRDLADVFAREPLDIADVFAGRPLVNDREFLGMPPGTVKLKPSKCLFIENEDGTWIWYLPLTFTPRADAADRRPEMDPQPVG